MSTTMYATRSRARALTMAGTAPQPVATPIQPSTAGNDTQDSAPTYSAAAAIPVPHSPSPPSYLGSPLVRGLPEIVEISDDEREPSPGPARDSDMGRSAHRNPSEWVTVPPRRSPTPESVTATPRAAQLNTLNRFAGLPVDDTRSSEAPPTEAEAQALRNLQETQRMQAESTRILAELRVQRAELTQALDTARRAVVASKNKLVSPSPTPSVQESTEARADKGKGPDVRNWGNAQINPNEADPGMQQAMLNSLQDESARREDPQAAQVASSSRVPHADESQRTQDEPHDYEMHIPENQNSLNSRFRRNFSREASLPIHQFSQDSVLGRMRQMESQEPVQPNHGAAQAPTDSSGHGMRAGNPYRDPGGPGDDDGDGPPYGGNGNRRPFGSPFGLGRGGFRGNMGPPPPPPPPPGGNPGGNGPPPPPPGHYPGGNGPPPPPGGNPGGNGPPPPPPPHGDPYGNYPGWHQGYPPYPYPQYRRPIIPPTAPNKWDGTPDLDKYIEFRDGSRRYLKQGQVAPEDQVEMIAPLLEGKAKRFYIRRVSRNPAEWTFVSFMDALFNEHFPKDFKIRLRESLSSNTQGSRSIWDYSNDLQNKLDTVAINDPRERAFRLWQGLSGGIERQLWLLGLNPEISSWDEIVEAAEAAEHALGVTKNRFNNNQSSNSSSNSNSNSNSNRSQSQNNNSGHSNRSSAPGSSNQNHRDRNPVQNNHNGNRFSNRNGYNGAGASSGNSNPNPARSQNYNGSRTTPNASAPAGSNQATAGSSSSSAQSRPSRTRLTEEQKREYMAQGKCFECGQHNHIASRCPNTNVVRSSTNNRPPGMSSFNMEMGYVDDLIDLDDTSPPTETVGVMDTLPLMSIRLGNPIEGTPVRPARCMYDRRMDALEFDADHVLSSERPRRSNRAPLAHYIRHEAHEAWWMIPHACPDALAREQIGDALAMQAEYALNLSQPYPGDPRRLFHNDMKGVRGRFAVYKMDDLNYAIYDRLLECATHVPTFRLNHPNFRVGRHYARYRARQLRHSLMEGEYNVTMGDAVASVATYLLQDGIQSMYPSTNGEIENDDRFNVQRWDPEGVTYVINDYDRDKYVLIAGDLLRNRRFNLTRWYQLAVRGERGLLADTFPLTPAPLATAQNDRTEGSSSESEHDSDHSEGDPTPEEAEGDLYDDLPELQSKSSAYGQSDSDESDISSSVDLDNPRSSHLDDFDWDLERRVIEDAIESNIRDGRPRFSMANAAGEGAVQALMMGAPYPGDPTSVRRPVVRFEVILEEPLSGHYLLFDHLRSEVAEVPIEQLRNPNFDIGLWYADVCASRIDGVDHELALIQWAQNPHHDNFGRDTTVGNLVETRLIHLLSLGAPYHGDDAFAPHVVNQRFSVMRDPTTSEYLIITDRRRAGIRILPSTLTESLDFDPAEWYELECECDTHRGILLDEVENLSPTRVFGLTNQTLAEAIATNPRAWLRVRHHVPHAIRQVMRDRRERIERRRIARCTELIAEGDDWFLGGIQTPRGSYPAVQRNASVIKSTSRLVPKPLVIVVDINSQPSRALIDSGSLGDFISSTLADQLKLKREPLVPPIPLQLAVQGSRSSINSFVKIRLKYQGIDEDRVFHVINVSSYDLILGTPFIYQHQVCIGLNPARVVIGSDKSVEIPAGSETKPLISAVNFEDPKVVEARKLLMELAEPLCKDVADTGLPPLRAINHTIPLIDESVIYPWRPSRCPEVFRPQWAEKRDVYLKTGRWETTSASNTVPMLLIAKPKRDKPELRTVFDLRERNKNTRKLTSPLPDIEGILRRVAKKPFRSALDLKAAYEQIRIVPEHVHRTAVTTPDGNIVSNVIQQGDCNAPATYQALMNHLFSTHIGVILDVYLDDIIIYSDTLEEHIEHVKIVYRILDEQLLYLSRDKLRFIVSSLDILGHIIDDTGIRMDPHKVDSVVAWKTPTNRDLLRGFIGSVGYLADDVPGVRIPMGVLSAITGDAVPFRWTHTEQRAFEDVKRLVQDARDHSRVPLSYEKDAPRIWLITDGCATGISGVVAQGESWKSAKVAAFYSAKLNPAQQNYPTHEIEMLAGVETMMRHQDILQGAKFTWLTDHKGLEHLLNQKNLSGRQARWIEKISSFDFNVEYVPGVENVLADSLSRMYSNESSGTVRARSEYTYHDVVNEDAVPIMEAPMPIFTSLEALAVSGSKASPPRRSARIKAAVPPAETRRPETGAEFARRMAPHFVLKGPVDPGERREGGSADNSPATLQKSSNISISGKQAPVTPTTREDNNTTTKDLGDYFQPLPDTSLVDLVESSVGPLGINLLNEVRRLYAKDSLFQPILNNPSEFRNFRVKDGLLYLLDSGKTLLCIPKGLVNGRSIREVIISEAHSILAHLGAAKTTQYLRDHVYWKDLVSNVKSFCESCDTCKRNKPDNQRPFGLLNPLQVSSYPWETIGVDFVGPLPESSNRDGTFDSITVIIDSLTSMVHLVPSRTDYTAKQVAELMFESVYKHHGLPRKIVSDRDVLFTSTFWQHLNSLLGTKLKMSSAYHPETDGLTERANRNLVQMIRELVNEKQSDWVQKLSAIEFAINCSKSDTTGYSPFVLNQGQNPRAMIWNSATREEFPSVRQFLLQRKLAIMSAHDSILAARTKQVRDANKKRRLAPFVVGDLVYLSTKNITYPKGMARKLIPRFIGPYSIIEDFGNQSFRLELSSDLRQRGVHDVFHASLLRVHIPNDDRLFPGRMDSQIVSSGPGNPDNEWAIDKILSHAGSRRDSIFEVQWKSGDVTWVPLRDIETTQAISAYLELTDVPDIDQLPTGSGTPPPEVMPTLVA